MIFKSIISGSQLNYPLYSMKEKMKLIQASVGVVILSISTQSLGIAIIPSGGYIDYEWGVDAHARVLCKM